MAKAKANGSLSPTKRKPKPRKASGIDALAAAIVAIQAIANSVNATIRKPHE